MIFREFHLTNLKCVDAEVNVGVTKCQMIFNLTPKFDYTIAMCLRDLWMTAKIFDVNRMTQDSELQLHIACGSCDIDRIH